MVTYADHLSRNEFRHDVSLTTVLINSIILVEGDKAEELDILQQDYVLNKYNEYHNLEENEVIGFVIEKVAEFPDNAMTGRIIDHTGLGNLYKCIDGSADGSVDTSDPSKWRAVGEAKIILGFTRDHRRLKSQWLRLGDGNIVSSVVGHRLWFAGAIKQIVVNTHSATDAYFRIYKKTETGFDAELCSLRLEGDYAKIGDFNVAVEVGDEIACFMDVVSGRVHFPDVKVILISF
jgi:hypothetical protein